MKKTLLIALAAVALVACGKKEANAEQAAPAEAAPVEETVAAPVAQEGMAPGAVYNLENDSLFRPDSKVDVLTILDFNAVWCGPCKMLHPVFEAAAPTYNNVQFVSVDIDKNPQTAAAFGVEAVPTVVFLKPDGTSERFVGTDELLPAEKFAELVKKNL